MLNSENSYKNQQVNKVQLVSTPPLSEQKVEGKAPKSTRLDLKARVGRHHFALLRGYLEGIDLRLLAQRYLHSEGAEAADLRIIKRLLRWTIDELIVLARRHGEFAFARAIDIEPSRIQASSDSETPSLDDFRAERDPDGFYSEAELLDLFRDEHSGGNNRKDKRNARLRERQNEALRWLETLVATDPQMSDALAGWFPDVLAARLNAVGIITIEELVIWINQRGMRWYSSVPKIGQEAAQRILTWLEMNRGSLKYTFGKQVFAKRSDLQPEDLPQRALSEGIAPFEYFRPAQELDGRKGSNRAANNRSTATTDIEAIQLWLDTCTQIGGPTWLSYRREAERFLAWCVVEKCKPMSSIDETDCIAYRQFLNDLGRCTPEQWKVTYQTHLAQWLGKRGTPRSSEAWRPFDSAKLNIPTQSDDRQLSINTGEHGEPGNGVLSLSSQRQAIVILKNLFSYLTKIHYLENNPFDAVKPLMAQGSKIQVKHSFSVADWKAILHTLELLPKDAHYFRLRFLLKFSYGTGLRLSELVSARYGDLCQFQFLLNGVEHTGCMLQVIGKRERQRTVPIPTDLLKEIHTYMAHRGYANTEQIPANTYLIGRLTNLPTSVTSALEQRRVSLSIDKLSARNLYQVLKNFFSYVYKEMHATDPESAKHIQKASTHWLRHTCGTHAVASGVDVGIIQTNFGHESLKTTKMYAPNEAVSRMIAMQGFLTRQEKTSE